MAGRPSNAELTQKTKEQEALIVEKDEALAQKADELVSEQQKSAGMRAELDEMKQMLENMQNMFAMQSMNMPMQSTPQYSVEEEEFYIGSNQMGEIRLYIDNREYSMRGGDAPVPFNKEEVKAISKHPKYGNLFRNGVLFFEEGQNYDKFRINPYIRLDDESLSALFEKEEKEIEAILKDVMAKSNRPDMIKQVITFKMAKFQTEGKMTDINKFNSIVRVLGIKSPMLINRQYLVAKEVKYY